MGANGSKAKQWKSTISAGDSVAHGRDDLTGRKRKQQRAPRGSDDVRENKQGRKAFGIQPASAGRFPLLQTPARSPPGSPWSTRPGWRPVSGSGKRMKTTMKTAKTVKPYSVRAFGWDIVVPAGSTVSNRTACGCDDSYRFWSDWQQTAQELTGYRSSILAHDLTYYGLNIPAEFCESYPANS